MRTTDDIIMDSLRKELKKDVENVQVPLRLQKESIVAMLKQEQKKDGQNNKDFSDKTVRRTESKIVGLPNIAAATTNNYGAEAPNASGAAAKNPSNVIDMFKRCMAIVAALFVIVAAAIPGNREVMLTAFANMKDKTDSMSDRVESKGLEDFDDLKKIGASIIKEQLDSEKIPDNEVAGETVPNQDLPDVTNPGFVIPETTVPGYTNPFGGIPGYTNVDGTPATTDSLPQVTIPPVTPNENEGTGGNVAETTQPTAAPEQGVAEKVKFSKTLGDYKFEVYVDTDQETGYVSEEIRIVNKESEIISRIPLAESNGRTTSEECVDIKINGADLIAAVNCKNPDGSLSTLALYYDVSNPANPRPLRVHEQDGKYVSIYFHGNAVCLVTNKNLTDENMVPSYSFDGMEDIALDKSRIKVTESNPDDSYIFVTVTDISAVSNPVGAYAKVGCGKNIQFSNGSIIISREFVDSKPDANGKYKTWTEITRLVLGDPASGNNTEITDAGVNRVEGSLVGTVYVDAENEKLPLRVVTETETNTNVYVFAEDMSALSASTFDHKGESKVTKIEHEGKNTYITFDIDGKEEGVIINFSKPEKPTAKKGSPEVTTAACEAPEQNINLLNISETEGEAY